MNEREEFDADLFLQGHDKLHIHKVGTVGYMVAVSAIKATKESSRKELEEKDRRIAELESQLPEGMEHCTILFKECSKGHGRLTATNWVQHECPTCEKEALKKKLAEQQVCIEEMLNTLRIAGAPKLAIIMSGLNKQGSEELTKREALARQQGFEEGKKSTLPNNYIQTVPDKCDRIVWRNNYYQLPMGTSFELGKQAGRDEVTHDLDFEPDEHHAVSDMANVGYSLMEAIRIAHPSYMWNDSPAEIVVDLLNEIGDMKTWFPINTAPQDNTLLLLLIEGGDNSTEDDAVWRTIGGNNYDNDGVDKWQFAGWCWSHDHFSEGSGKVIGWVPLTPRPSAPVKGE